ncbi:MAG: 50S ribosomal protein L25/general stress protein Ctc [Gemmatimonadota bacterium]|nr:50S ribosomal protein L25/general stress protein Ctc [Gemmatimonadota bacterium]
MSNENATLHAEPRNETGRSAARLLRRSGGLPAVVYGDYSEPVALTVDTHEFERLMARIHAATTVISLEVEGTDSQQVLIREIQRHPFRSDFLHVDFLKIRAGQKIKIQVPVHLQGLAAGVELGGIMQQIRHELEVECVPTEIPSEITVDVSAMDIGDSIHIGDIDAGDIVILDDADLTICTCVQPTVIVEPEEEELEEGEEGELAEGEEGAEAEAGDGAAAGDGGEGGDSE